MTSIKGRLYKPVCQLNHDEIFFNTLYNIHMQSQMDFNIQHI